ncbi:MAG: branched-chain amino acid ABC transporter permease [Acidobacteria bacterium]|nr:branched-chain amino acid ABC transporter permease [Acidobacteriota bacterium]
MILSKGLSDMGRRVVGVFLLGVMAMALFVAFAPPAFAEGEMIGTRLRYTEPNSGERVAVSGVSLTVEDTSGETIAEGVTDADGIFEVEVPGSGRYGLTIFPETLPEGVFLADPDNPTKLVEVLVGQTGRAIFQLVNENELAGLGQTSTITFRRVAQLTVEGLKFGVFLAMAAIGLSLIFGTTGLVNFAHGEMIGWGMLWAYLFNFYGFAGMFGFMEGWPAPFGDGVNLIFATLMAIVMGLGLGWAMDKFIFAPLRARGTAVISAMIVTIGLSILIRYVYLFVFGGVPRFYRDYTAQVGIKIGVIEITPKDLITGLLSVAILVLVGLFLQRARMGKAMRAVADDRDLAESSGIDVQRVIRFVWVAGSGLAALGGVFIGLSEQVSWNIGFRILLLIFAAVVLGGLGTAYGALVGALIVGVGIQVSTLWIPPELKNLGALVLLIVALLIRPQGILGKAERIG